MRKLVVAVVASIALPGVAFAQTYPNRPVRLVVPFSAGGGVDTVTRALANELTGALGQPVIVDNRPGGNSAIGSDFVAKQPADGYTILVTAVSHYLLPFLAKSLPYDATRDFTPVTIFAKAPQALVVNASVPARTMAELIDYAKKNPGKLSYGTAGAGTSQHIGGEMLNFMTGLDIVHVPYKGGSQALNDLVGGQVPMAILILSNVIPHVKSGKVRVLGVIESTRAKAAPDVPTVAQAGLPGYAIPDTWLGFLGPAGVPQDVLQRLDGEVRKIVELPAVRSRLDAAGFEVYQVGPADFAKLAPQITETYRQIVTSAKIKAE